MKNVTLLAVKHAALLLIETNQKTTTLEVKGLLRDLDYFAEQIEISTFMDIAAQELPLTFSPGQFRTYELPSVRDLYADADDDTSVSTHTVTVTTSDDDDGDNGIIAALQAADLNVSRELFEAANYSYTSRKNELVLLYDDPTTIQDLGGVVSRVSTGAGRSFYFTQPVRRDLARSAHASTLGMDYNDTRSSTVHL